MALEEATSGEVRIQSLWMPVVPRRDGIKTVLQVLNRLIHEIESSNLQVYVDSCRLLPSVRGRQPDPRVKLFVAEDQVKETVPVRFNRCLICLFMRRKSQPASELQESCF